MIRAVVFDLGGVVIRFTNREYYHYLSGISGKSYAFVNNTIESGPLIPFEKGKISVDEFDGIVAKRLGILKKQVMWNEFYKKTVKMNYDMLELVRELQKEYITAFLSNVDIPRYYHTAKVLDLNLFDYRFQSCYIKARKPELKIYRYVLRKMGLKPEETVFIDDRIENVRGARKAGMRALQFRSRRLLDRELAKLGL